MSAVAMVNQWKRYFACAQNAGLVALLLLAASCGEDRPAAPAVGEEAAVTGPESEASQDIDVWLERLEVGSRELYSAREAVVAAVGLSAGDVVADVGAGTGLYTLLFSEAVGPDGIVYAEDIEPLFLDLVNQRAADMELTNVTAVLGREDDVTLPNNSVDVVFIADSYHYFDDRETIMKSVLDALKPGGRLVMVEYDIVQGKPRPEGKEHVKFGKPGVISEIEFVGFEFLDETDVPGLNETYFVVFRKPLSD